MTETASRLDWFSFSCVDPYKPDNSWEDNAQYHANYLLDVFGLLVDPDIKPGRQWQHTRLDGEGVTLFYGSDDSRMTVEISGKGCERMHNAGTLVELVKKAMDIGTVTRMDIAVDMKCDVDPRDFVKRRKNKRQKSEETAVSNTGITCYVGSRKSDRYARVYRYHPPHPRADLLRCEMVFRGLQAERAVKTWLAVGDEETAARSGNIYGWKHEAFTPKARRR